jgi:hypothetical protein
LLDRWETVYSGKYGLAPFFDPAVTRHSLYKEEPAYVD